MYIDERPGVEEFCGCCNNPLEGNKIRRERRPLQGPKHLNPYEFRAHAQRVIMEPAWRRIEDRCGDDMSYLLRRVWRDNPRGVATIVMRAEGLTLREVSRAVPSADGMRSWLDEPRYVGAERLRALCGRAERRLRLLARRFKLDPDGMTPFDLVIVTWLCGHHEGRMEAEVM